MIDRRHADVLIFKHSNDAPKAKIHRQFEGNRDMLDYVENTITGAPDVIVSNYDYTTDNRGRRLRKRIFLYNNGRSESTSTPNTDLKFSFTINGILLWC